LISFSSCSNSSSTVLSLLRVLGPVLSVAFSIGLTISLLEVVVCTVILVKDFLFSSRILYFAVPLPDGL